MKASLFRHGINLWPPFLFAGIHVTHVSDDYRYVRVELRMRPWNRNYVGTHFGGSLFAMTDPFWMLTVMQNLGRNYFVWDRAGEIEFLKPGRGTVVAEFRLDDTLLEGLGLWRWQFVAASPLAAPEGARGGWWRGESWGQGV